MRVHESIFRPPRARDAIFGAARPFGGERLTQFHAGRRLFFEQQREGASLGDVFKTTGDRVARQRVGQRRQRHALMMRHIAFDQFRPLSRTRAGVVGGFVEAVVSRPARFAHGKRVVRRLRGADAQRQQRRVRRDHALARASAQRHFAQAKGAVLVVGVHVEGVIAGFAHAPRALPRLAQPPLQARDGIVRLIQERAGARAHEQFRHQVFKHGAAPGNECLLPAKAHAGAGEAAEVLGLHLAQHHRNIAEDARLRSQQVVVRGAHAFIFHIRADAKEFALLIKEAGKVHILRQRAQAAGKRRVERAHPGGAGQKRGGEISAVHRGDIARAQGAQRVDIVPVIELAAPLFHALKRFHRGQEPFEQLLIAEEAERTRRDAGDQIEADVGGRCAAGRADGGIDLHVVRRQGVFSCGDICLKETPRLARQLCEGA